MEAKSDTNEGARRVLGTAPDGQNCLFAHGPSGITVGVVTTSHPSSLALLAAGVAGLAARRARRQRAQSVPPPPMVAP
jgi:MYXO-CTERM domain-containing protein